MIGIYCIENIINNKKYIGQSINITERKRKHFSKLKQNKHENYHLQKSYNKYGIDNFKFYIIEECKESELNDREIFWINKFNSLKDGYNQTIGGTGINGWVADDDFKRHMSNITKGENNGNYGNYWTDKQKETASKRMIGKYVGNKNPNSKKIVCIETFKIYDTILDCVNDIDTIKSETSISRCLKNKKYLAGNYHFAIYTDDFYLYIQNNQFEYLCDCYKDSGYYADFVNKKIYKRYELLEFLHRTTKMTIREINSMFGQEIIIVNDIEYKLL